MRVTEIDRVSVERVSCAVVRPAVTILAALLLALGACGSKSKKSKTTPGSSGSVATEDTKLMGDGTPVGDGAAGDGKGDKAAGGDGKGDKAAGDGKGDTTADGKPKKPEPPKIEPPDLDVSAAAQTQRVKKHLEVARNALRGTKKDPDLAIREAKAALAVDAGSVDAVVLIAHAYYTKRLYDTAEVMLDMMYKDRKSAKSNATVFYVYGLIYDRTDRPERALLAYQTALKLRRDYKSALVNIGVHHLRKHKYQDAIAVYEKLTNKMGVNNATTWTNLGSAYRGRSGDYGADSSRRMELLRQAETAYKRALTIKKDYANVYYNLGLLYLDADPFPNPDGSKMDKLKRLERSKTYFDEYQNMSGADIDLVARRSKQVKKLIKRETKRRKREANKKKKKKKKNSDDDW